MRTKAIFAFLLLSVLLLSACSPSTTVEPSNDTTPPTTSEVRYDAACAKLNASSNRIISYEYSEKRTVGSDTYTEKITGSDSYSGIGTDQMQAVVSQTLHYGTYQTDYVEFFLDDTAFSAVNGSNFATTMNADSFLARHLPGVLVDRSLYKSITEQPDGESTLLKFTQPTALEAWVSPDQQAELITAYATALLDANNTLQQYHYEASYSYDNIVYYLTVDSQLTVPQQLDLSAALPEFSSSAVKLTCLDAPKLLLQAVGDFFTAQSFSSKITQVVDSKVYTLTQKQESNLHLYNSDDALSALWNTTLTLTDFRNEPATKKQSDRYENGVLTRIVDGKEQSQEEEAAEQILLMWENQILNGFFALNYLDDATVTNSDDTLVLSFSGNNAFCKAVSASCQAIIPNDLDSMASSYKTNTASGSLTIDKVTGLPVAMSIDFKRTHIIDGISYPLSYTLKQTLKLSDESTFDVLFPSPEA